MKVFFIVTCLLISHTLYAQLFFKSQAIAVRAYGDVISVSLDDKNDLYIYYNGEEIKKAKNWCKVYDPSN